MPILSHYLAKCDLIEVNCFFFLTVGRAVYNLRPVAQVTATKPTTGNRFQDGLFGDNIGCGSELKKVQLSS